MDGSQKPVRGKTDMEFKHYQNDNYEAVCDFLIALNRDNQTHINWNWARFEWMMEHPEFDKSLSSSIGLWWEKDQVVGAAIYYMYFGEAFCAVLPGYESFYPAILDYAYRELQDDNGLGIAVNDSNQDEIKAVTKAGFSPAEQSETIMRIDLLDPLPVKLPDDLRLTLPHPVDDAYEIQWLFWQGFDHGSDRAAFEQQESPTPQTRPHFNRELSVAAVNADGAFVAYCCLWYSDKTDYAYVEPVCTIPPYRGKGIAKALIYEALNRAQTLGAKEAYVISDSAFYEKLGFRKTYHYTFYWKQQKK